MNNVKFAANWLGRKFRCEETGEVVELTIDNVRPRAYISVGNGAIDLGDGYYSRRLGKVEEVKES